MTHAPADLLDRPYDLTDAQREQFRRDGFIKLKNVFDAATLDRYAPVITDLTLANAPKTPLGERDTYGKAFIQVGNLWEKSDDARAFTFSKRLAKIAADLLDVEGVRLYHDQALYKEPAGGFTPWHVDQQYWPMSSGKSVTAWVPLQPVPIDMGPLEFGKGSHLKNIGRDLAISDESERQIREAIREHGVVSSFEPYDLGEVSFHLGWTLHRAGGNTTDRARKVHTVIYFDKDMPIAEPRNENQRRDLRDWFSDRPVGGPADGPLNPVLYPA